MTSAEAHDAVARARLAMLEAAHEAMTLLIAGGGFHIGAWQAACRAYTTAVEQAAAADGEAMDAHERAFGERP